MFVLFFSYNVFSEVKTVEWLDKSGSFTSSEGDIVGIVLNKQGQVDRSYNKNESLSETPFPQNPENNDQNAFSSDFQFFNYKQPLTIQKRTISSKQIKKKYGSRFITNQFKHVIRERCHPYYLEEKLLASQDLNEFDQLLKTYFKSCDRRLVNSFRNKYADLAKVSLRKYKVLSNKNTHPFKVKFDNGESLEGFLALKPSKVRPLVIVKCGVFCNGKSSTINNTITANLYDSGPFHIMLIANHTGSRNIQQNKRVNIGGFIEGQEIIKVAKWAKKNSYFKNYISDIHVLGISLGGSGALFSGIYNDHLDEKIINSVIGFCPVTNVRNSVKDVTARGLIGYVVSHNVMNLIKDNYNNIPYLKNHIDLSKRTKRKHLAGKLAGINVDYINTLDEKDFLAPFTGVKVESTDDYYYYNDYNNFAHLVETPTFIFASNNDPVVRYKRNSQLIDASQNDNLQILNVRKGSHCAVQESYGWHTISKILNSFFIKHSPSLSYTKKQEGINFTFPPLRYGEKYSNIRLLTFANSDRLVIEFKIFTGEPYQDPFYARDEDFKRSVIELNMKDLPFEITPPTTDVEAQILTRWLNANVSLKNDDSLMHFTREPAGVIEWSEYQTR